MLTSRLSTPACRGSSLSRQRCVGVRAAAVPPPVQFNIHGRHVTVDDTLEALVKEKLQPALKLLRGAEFVEGEGGVHDCDVKLMNSQVELKLRPLYLNKETNDTYLRQGEIKVLEMGTDVYDSLDKAVDSLTRKLKKMSKPLPKKKDYSAKF